MEDTMTNRLFPTLALFAAVASAQVQWLQRFQGEPYPRYRHAIAWHGATGRTLLFSGAPNPVADTWEWDGAAWFRLFPATSPPWVSGAYGLAYDAARQRTVCFLQNNATGFGQTWEWDGATWTQLFPAATPPSRDRPALAYDAARGRTVLFGGHRVFVPQGDTWEWDGVNWTQRFPATSPPARSMHAMCYDPVRQRLALFGGFGAAAPLDDTWEWDGNAWAQRAPAVRPAPRYQMSLAWDVARARAVMFGGTPAPPGPPFGDTWEWDGAAWTQRFPATSPPPHYEYGLAHDASRGVTVLFGGSGTASPLTDTWEWNGTTWTPRPVGPLARFGSAMAFDPARRRSVLFSGTGGMADTWEWDGSGWASSSPPGSPPARVGHAMTWDAARGRTLLFGGQGTMALLGDTWNWDGASWTQLSPAAGPSPRQRHALAFDAVRGRAVLFGGLNSPVGVPLGETWEWDGASWAQLFPAAAPAARDSAAMAFDATRGRVILFGGWSCPHHGGCTYFADTWEWDGVAWTQRSPATSPPARGSHVMAYDPIRRRVVVSGGRGSATYTDAWEWDGTNWTPRAPATAPTARAGHAAAFDAARGRLVVFGGQDQALSKEVSDVWEYFAPCDPIGPGHPGGGLAIACVTPPRVGTTFCVSFSDPPPMGTGASLLVIGAGACLSPPLPLAPPAVCAPASLWTIPIVVLSGVGEPAQHCVALPPAPGLAGQAFCLQGAAFETGNCFRLTDGLAVTLQP
jgi:hypothetical protein